MRFLAVVAVLAGLLLALVGCGGDQDMSTVANLRAPRAVQDLVVTPGDGRIRINWSPVEEEDLVAYKVYRSLEPEAAFTLVGSVGRAERPYYEDLGDDTDGDGVPDGLANGVTYHYRVTGVDRDGFEATFQLAPRAEGVPSLQPGSFRDLAVSNLRVYEGADAVLLTWSPLPQLAVRGYAVYRVVLQEPGEPVLLGMAWDGQRHYSDLAVAREEDYRYLVAPVNREGEEGRRLESRVASLREPDDTVPLAPGHDLAAGPFLHVETGDSGVTMTWGRPIQNSDGSFFDTRSASDDLIGGGTIVYRGELGRDSFEPIAILEETGSEVSHSYTDPDGTLDSVYMVRAFDRYGTLGFESRRISGGALQLPDLVRGLDAFASTSGGLVQLTWTPDSRATGGYRVFRSRSRDRGYMPLADLPPTVGFMTDGSALAVGDTLFYRVAPLTADADLRLIQGALGSPATATPGPSDGVFHLEAEDAQVIVGPTSAAGFTAFQRRGLARPWSGRGGLEVTYSNQAQADATTFTLRWVVDVNASAANPILPRQYEIRLGVREDDRAPTIDAAFVAVGSVLGNGAAELRRGIELFEDRFGTPENPTMVRVGSLAVEDFNIGGGLPVAEVFELTVTLRPSDPRMQGDGRLLIDDIVLVEQ